MVESGSSENLKRTVKLDIDSSKLICPKSGKKLDFVCTKKNASLCSNRLCCSTCILSEYSEDFPYMVCLEDLIKPESEKKLSELKPEQRQEMEQYLSKKEDNTKKFSQKIDTETDKVKNWLKELKEKVDAELNNLETLITENANTFKKEFRDNYEELKTALQPKKEEIQGSSVTTVDELKSFLDTRIKAENDIQDMKFERIYDNLQDTLKCLSMIRFNDKQSTEILDQFDKLVSFFIAVDKLSFYKKNVYVPLSKKNYNSLTCTQTITTSHKKSIYKVIFMEDETEFVTCSDDSTIIVWNLKTGKEIRTLTGHTDRIWTIIKLRDGRFASASSDQKVRIWNVAKGSCERVLSGHTGYVCALMEFPHSIIVSGSQDKSLKFWDLNEKDKVLKRTITDPKQGRIMCMTLVSNDQMAVGSEKDIQIYNVEEGKIFKTLTGHTALLRDLLILDDNVTLFSGSDDRSIKMWNLTTYTQVRTFTGHNHSANKIHLFSPGVIVSASDDYTIKFWTTDKGECVKTLSGHTGWVIYCTIMNDGTLVTCGADKTVKFWS
mmetsp:Transcript_47653/g.55116  ORF Transcript_47653/g.55116 Transcript_47653/m.55116 type:complete len:549 (+) Transcript_47653:30-1676(+)